MVDCQTQEVLPNSSCNILRPGPASLSTDWQQQQPGLAFHPPNMSRPLNAPWWQHPQDDMAIGPSQIVQQLQLSQQNPVQYNCTDTPPAPLHQGELPSQMLCDGPSKAIPKGLNLNHSFNHLQPRQHSRHDDILMTSASTSLPSHQQRSNCPGGHQPIGVNTKAAGTCIMPDRQGQTPAADLHGSKSHSLIGLKALGLEATMALVPPSQQVCP